MQHIKDNISNILASLRALEAKYQRPAQQTQLLIVSKAQQVASIHAALMSGERNFGENQIQDALPKIQALAQYNIQWHFIGQVQSNKTRAIAEHFSWCQSIDREKIARRLNEQRRAALPPLNVCIQINISREHQKAGIQPTAAASLAKAISHMPRLKLRGLMGIASANCSEAMLIQEFSQLRTLQNELIQQGHALDTLSMGMSQDYQVAIGQGSTMVRIGSAIFKN